MRTRSAGISRGWGIARRSTVIRLLTVMRGIGRSGIYKRHLKAVERWKPASVNLALAALDSFYTQ
jgi:hypothetical protein